MASQRNGRRNVRLFGERVFMHDDAVQKRSERLAARLEALAVALQESGISEEAAARLLANASAAAQPVTKARRKPALPKAA